MKLFKKGIAALLAVFTALVVATPAFAADTYKITVPSGDTHTYEVYQILTGDLSSDGKTLSNVAAGKNFNGTDAVAAAEAIAKTTATTDAEKLAAITPYVKLDSEPYGTVKADTDLNVPAGYYLLKDKDGSLDGQDDAYTTYIVKVVNNVEVSRKADKPSVQKKVKDVNDSKANSTTDWQDSADYDVNDAVPFQLTATLPTNATDFAAYKTYKLVFHDVQSAGLTFNYDSVVVKYGETTLSSDSYSVTTNTTDGCTFEVTINDVKSVKDASGNAVTVAAGGKFYVEYTSTLNENSVIGSKGNPDEVFLEYSNNPNAGGEGETGKTPKDKVIVFTYQVDVNKVDASGTPLEGAGFTLYKKNAEGTYVQVGQEIKATKTTDGKYTSSFLRVDDGDYKLVETTVPDGYNKIADVEFTIDATHDTTSDDPKLLTLTGGNKFTGSVETGALTTSIENKKGSELPSTGGMGTTVLYAIGGALVVAAGCGLVVKKRMAAK